MARTLIYTRCSTDEQAQSGLGLEAQQAECLEFVRTQGLRESTIYVDVGVSRSTLPSNREGLGSLLTTIRRGDSLLCHKHDRLGDVVAIALVLKELKRKGARLLVVHGDNSGSDEALLLLGILSVVSDHELRTAASRTRRAIGQKRAKGERYTRRVYGAQVNAQGLLEEVPEEQAVIQRIIEERDYSSLREIAARLNEDQIPAPEGIAWYPATVSGIVKRCRQSQVA